MSLEALAASIFSTPEQVSRLADLSHSIPAVSFIIVALLVLVVGFGYKTKTLTLAYSMFLCIFSAVFALAILFYGGLNNIRAMARLVWYYPEIRVHIIQSLALVVGSAVEYAVASGHLRSMFARLAFPGIFIVIGITNVLHPHGPVHDEHHATFHALLGVVMILAGMFLSFGRLVEGKMYQRLFLLAGVLSMLIFCGMLISFRELPQAYAYAFPTPSTIDSQGYVDLQHYGVVYLYDDYASPLLIKIQKGGIVKFVQLGKLSHDMASGPHITHADFPPLNMGPLPQGSSYEVTFSKAGNFSFHDHDEDENTKLQGRILVYQ